MANPLIVGVSTETVTKIATNVKTFSIELFDTNSFFHYYTYKLTGVTAPTAAEMLQEMRPLFDSPETDTTENFAYQAAVDIYDYCKNVPKSNVASNVNKTTLTVSATLVTDDSTVVTINDETTTATNYDTVSHATTMATIAGKIEALTGVLSATVSTNDIIVLSNLNTVLSTTDITVTNGGAGTAVGSEVDTISGKLRVDL